jgi:signal transduction histidine kinase
MVFEASNIEEFNELNGRLKTLVLKIKSDYNTLKQFTEDVSHEAQTPLAIMQAKIENIINQQQISDDLYEDLTSIQKDIKRLTQLNKRLVLLAKIDNNQFSKAEKVDLATVICERIEDFQDISEHTFKKEVSPNSNVIIDSYLAEILTNNLLSNAVKYSDPKSIIFVKVSQHMLEVSNKGTTMIEQPDKIFERFYRESSNKKSTGLGLSIVSKICGYYGFDASYRFRESEQLHVFRITFTK